MGEDKKKSKGCGCLIGCLITALLLLFLLGLLVLYVAYRMGLGEEHFNDLRSQSYLAETKDIDETDLSELDGDKDDQMDRLSQAVKALGDSKKRIAEREIDDVYHYYQELSEDQKLIYLEILQGLEDMEEEISLICSEDDLKYVVYRVYYDHPELFWADFNYSYTGYQLGSITTINLLPVYNCTPEEKETKEIEVQAALDQAMEEIVTDGSDYDCIRSIYEYVIGHVDYELDSPDNQNIYSSMVNQKSVCAGYAREVQYLLQKNGFDVIYVAGKIDSGGEHAWNIVRMGDNYYHVDATFGDIDYARESEDEVSWPDDRPYDYFYLCADDEMMLRDRSISGDLPVPACEDDSYDYFKLIGHYFSQCDPDAFDSIESSIWNDEDFWQGQFDNPDSFNYLLEEVEDGWYSRHVLDYQYGLESVRTYYSYDEKKLVVTVWY